MDVPAVKSDDCDGDPQLDHVICRDIRPIYQYMWAIVLLSALRLFLECGPFGWVAYSLAVCLHGQSMLSEENGMSPVMAWFFLAFAGVFLVVGACMSVLSVRLLRGVQQCRPGANSEPISEVIVCLDVAYVPLWVTTGLHCIMLALCLVLLCSGSAWKDLADGLSCPRAKTPEAKIARFMTLWMGLTAVMIYTGCCVSYKLSV
ncbi:uncharacterized protein LOC129582400 [Paramacrobiotus metropolitanus]|uniref:uncharacterized protein LOC129582400 n=1 Tax=Paramacrobiotus metropolitanus TaxID=2943436 RepID=UPI0024463FAA|nr:uncharacterized protein LOC129582400 [Paramacrobiotus metropolitanus]